MRRTDILLIVFLWAVLTAFNLTKAFHIDDTFHLEAAEWIRQHPGLPMSGMINWGDVSTPMYTHNQPPLFFFLLSVVVSVFGPEEVPLHLFLSAFTFLALFVFYLNVRLLNAENQRTLLVLFALCPAFVVNQNVMTDVPVLSLLLVTAYFLVKAADGRKGFNYSMAAMAIATGMMIKYSFLPVLAIFPVVLAGRRDWRYLPAMLIPLAAIGLWSAWNINEFGAVHLLNRPGGEIHINQFWSFLACAGAVGVFAMALLHGNWPVPGTGRFIFVITGLAVIAAVLLLTGVLREQPLGRYLNVWFVFNGLLIFAIISLRHATRIRAGGLHAYLHSGLFVPGAIFFAISLFLVLFAPFMATRHILLIVPFALLAGHEAIALAGKWIIRLTVALTLVLGIWLGVSDWKYADYYRQMASKVEIPVDRDVWTAGHWGWQWYARLHGMKLYERGQSKVDTGDLLVFPADISRQQIDTVFRMELVEKQWEESDMLTFFSGMDNASLYNSAVDRPPWRLSFEPADTIMIFRITGIRSEIN